MCIKLTPLIAVIVPVEAITRYALLGWDADVHHKEKVLPKQTEPEPFRNQPTKLDKFENIPPGSGITSPTIQFRLACCRRRDKFGCW
jgi:hypothetical protein